MSEPLSPPPLSTPEASKPPEQIIVGETKLYLVEPITVGGQDVSSITIQSAEKRGIEGVGSSVLLTREASRKKGSEGVMVDKPMNNLNDFDEVSWDKVSGIQYRDESGTAHTIEKDKLSLTPPENQNVGDLGDLSTLSDLKESPEIQEPPQTPVEPPQPSAAELAALAEKPLEAPRARAVLETLKEDPTTITIVGLKAYESRARDLAERSMQHMVTPKMLEREGATRTVWEKTKDSVNGIGDFVGNTLWKQSIGGIYFQEKARQYYMDMLQAAETPFVESSIRVAEARAQVNYDKMLADKNFLNRAGTQAIEWFKDKIGARSVVQQFALEEIRAMKEAGELAGTDIFEREAKAVRLRFGQDMEHADQFVRKALGEQLEILDPEKDEHKPLVEGVQSLMKRYATGEIADKSAFDAESKTFFKTTLKDAKPEIFAEAELYSSSLFDAAENLRAKASHEGGLANIDADLAQMKIRLGLGQMGEATSSQPDVLFKSVQRMEKIVSWIESKNIPLRPFLVNEATIGSGVAILLSAANVFKTMPARIIGGLGAGAIAGGTFAGMREYNKLQSEYLTHVREREVGTTFGEHLKQRKWFEKYVVKQRSADDLMTTLQSNLYTPEGVLKDNLSVDELRSSFATLADIQARKTLSESGLAKSPRDTDTKRIGLIQFTGRENIESQRTALDIVASKALSDLSSLSDLGNLPEEILGGNSFPDFMVKLTTHQTQILKEGVQAMQSMEDPYKNVLGIISSYAPEVEMIKRRWPFAGTDLPADMKAQGIDAIFSEFKKEARVEAIKYGIKSGVIGAATGAVLHEAFALIGGGLHDGTTHVTEAIKHTIKNQTEASTFAPGIGAPTETFHLTPDAGHVWHSSLGDYQIPKELVITPHGNTFDAVLQHNGPLGHDISIGHDLKADALLKELHTIKGLQVVEGHEAVSAVTREAPIPELVTKYGDQIKAELPAGYHFEHVTGAHESWNLFDHNKLVAQGLHFKIDGSLDNTSEVKSQLITHGLKLDLSGKPITIDHHGMVMSNGEMVPAGSTLHGATGGVVENAPLPTGGETITLDSKNMADGNVWDYFVNKGGNATNGNAMKNLFRLYEHQHNNSNITYPDGSVHTSYFNDVNHPTHFRDATFGDTHVREINLNRIPNDAQFNLPKELFGDDAIAKFAKLDHDALIRYNEVLATAKGPVDALHILETSSNKTDHLDAAVLRLGYFGRDSDLKFSDEQMKLLYEHMGYHEGAVASAVPSAVSAAATPIHEIPVDPVTLHPIRIFTEGTPATAGKIFATNNTIDVPYLLPTQQEAAVAVAHQLETGVAPHIGSAETPFVDKLPWFPVFLYSKHGLESARSANPEMIESIDLSSTMLSPFGMETELVTREQLAKRMSPRLNESADAQLDAQQEVAWYLENLSEEDRALTTELMSQEPSIMSATTKAAVIIPVSNNSSQVSQTLSHYLSQTDKDGNPLDPKAYELVIYNALVGEGAEDQLKTIVDQFKTDHPDHQVVYLAHTYTEEPTNGKLKRDVSNVVMQRIASRVPTPSETAAPTTEPLASDLSTVSDSSNLSDIAPSAETPPPTPEALPDVAIVNDPGPVHELPTTYLSSMMEGVSKIDMVVGQFTYPKEVYEALPMVFAPYRAYELVDALTRHTHGDNVPNAVSGNIGVRASTLAAIGGYNAKAVNAEDRELAWMIQTARNNADSVATQPDVVTFDPKNMLYAQLQRAQVAEAAGALEQNEQFKDMSWQDMGEKVKEIYTKDMMEQDLTNMYNGLYPALKAKDAEAFDRNFHFALDSLGLAHEITDGKITVLDATKLDSAITGIPDIESFGKVTAEQFAQQDATAREILENMAGPQPEQEAAVSPEVSSEAPTEAEVAPTETLGSHISSPDVGDLGNPGDLSKETPPPVQEPLPEGINDRIDYVLEKNQGEKAASVSLTPGELMHYLKTDLDIKGTRVVGGNLTYTDGKLHLKDLTAKSWGGEYQFTADMMSDPQKGLVVDPATLQMKLPMLGKLFAGPIRDFALNLNKNMLDHIDQRSNPMWKASRVDLVGEKLQIKFNKKV